MGGSVNDAFVAELDASNFTIGPNNEVIAPRNFAFDEGGNVISVNTAGFSAANSAGTTYDGATSLLRASTPVAPGRPRRLRVHLRPGGRLVRLDRAGRPGPPGERPAGLLYGRSERRHDRARDDDHRGPALTGRRSPPATRCSASRPRSPGRPSSAASTVARSRTARARSRTAGSPRARTPSPSAPSTPPATATRRRPPARSRSAPRGRCRRRSPASRPTSSP